MEKYLKQAQIFWRTRTGAQRGWLAGGALGTVALLTLLAHLVLTPEMKPVMTGMETADAQALAASLTSKGIENKLAADGKGVLVPEAKLDAARLEAVSGASGPHSGRMGFEIFDKVSWGETEFDEKVNYQRALEGELERTITTMGAIKSARVHLVMASDSVFLDQAHGAKASITVKLRGDSLSHEEVTSIQRLVAGAVDGLKPADVAIIDADSNRSLGSGAGAGQDDDAGELEKRLEARLVATLTPVLGADHVRASVNVEYDPGTTEQSSEEYDPQVSVPLTVQRSDEESGAGTSPGGVPGTASNVPDAKGKLPNTPDAPGLGSQSIKNENSTYGVNKVVSHSIEPAGRLHRITAALLVDDATLRRQLPKGKWEETRVHRSPEELKQIEDLASAAIGLDKNRGDVLTVEDMSFAQPTPDEVKPPTVLDRARKTANDFSDVLKYAFLLALFALAYGLVLRPMQKKALAASLNTQALEAPAEAQPAALAAGLKTAGALAGPSTEDEQTVRAQGLKDQLVQMVRAQPQHSVETVQAWIRGEEVQ